MELQIASMDSEKAMIRPIDVFSGHFRAWLTILASIGLIPPTLYYFRVALEVGKIVFEARSMSPP
jgi:hypothetical protein